ncbi:hypothetical protein [Sphingomonas montanisoli]|uniref:hypothetical protein n=1 Tax=Sphingomonas montanisoli TaxID=2606412 RepID=UPI0015E19145|nr:hypothetical protein [Sphingomonas montanisoli]
MSDPTPKASRAAGAILALTIVAGAFIGGRMHQPTIGIIVGTAIGAAITIGLWLYDRRR